MYGTRPGAWAIGTGRLFYVNFTKKKSVRLLALIISIRILWLLLGFETLTRLQRVVIRNILNHEAVLFISFWCNSRIMMMRKKFFWKSYRSCSRVRPPHSIPHCYNLTYISSKGLFSFFVFRLVFWSFLFSSHNLSDAIFFTLPCSFFLQPSLLYLIVFFFFLSFLARSLPLILFLCFHSSIFSHFF